MAIGDKIFVVMRTDCAVPGGVATLGTDAKLAEAQRPDYAINQVTGLQDMLDVKQNKILVEGLLKGDGNGNVTVATPGEDYGWPALTGSRAPTGSTKGAVGQHYLNTAAGKEYTCVAADEEAGVYTWKESGSGSGNVSVSGNVSGSVITITFDPEFAGQAFTVSDGSDTVTGTVPEGLAASVNAANVNSTYTVMAELNGLAYYTSVTIGPYFGQYIAVLTAIRTYGVRWSGGPETTWSRTDYAESFLNPEPFVNDNKHPGWSPFDNLMPWAGMKIVDDPILGKLVSIPKFWYKWTKSGAVMTLQISDKAQDGFFVSPAHADREDGQGERDVVYIGRYHCGENYKSASGALPIFSITRATARDAISALAPAAWQHDFALFWTVRMLYLVEFADWNSQKVIGCGCGNNCMEPCGASDDMPYHTGTMQTTRDTYGAGCQYRWIEGLWDNVFNFVDGIYGIGTRIYCINSPNNFSDGTNGTYIGEFPPNRNFSRAWSIPSIGPFNWALYPSEIGGTEETYIPDHCVGYAYEDGNSLSVYCGGFYTQGQNMGLFCLGDNIPVSDANFGIGCRLMKLPNKEEG